MDEPLIDCHVHVFDPDRLPYAADAYYIPTGPETGTVEQLRQTHDVHGVRHALPVGPNSGYGEDNRCLLDAVARGAGRFRGVAVVSNRATPAELSGLRDDGVLGVTLNAALLGSQYYAEAGKLLSNLADLELVADVQVAGDQLPVLAPLLARSRSRTNWCPTAPHGARSSGTRPRRAFVFPG